MILQGRDPPHARIHCNVKWSRVKGRWVGSWGWDFVPPGEYEIRLNVEDPHRWVGERSTATVPAVGVDFWCDDTGPHANLGFRVLEAASGEPIESCRVSWFVDGEVWHGPGEWGSGDSTLGGDEIFRPDPIAAVD